MLRKYFFKRVRTYFLYMIIPTLILFIVVGYFFISIQLRRIQEGGQATLYNLSNSLEVTVYNLGYYLDVMTSNFSFSLPLRNMLATNTMQQSDVVAFHMTQNFFSSFHLAYPYIHSMYLYLDGNDRFLSSASSQIPTIEQYYDNDWLDIYQQMADDEIRFASQRQIHRYAFDQPVQVITLFQRMSHMNGVIVINIDLDKYQNLLRNAMVTEFQNLFLFSSHRDMLGSITTEQNNAAFERAFALFFDDFLATDDYATLDGNWWRIDNHLFFLNAQYSEQLNIYNVSAIPFSYLIHELRYYLLLVLAILFLDIMIVFSIAYLYTRRSFFFIQECINVFSEAEKGEEITYQVSDVKDEFGIILNNMIYLHLRNNQMKMNLMERQYQYELSEKAALQLQINPHFIFNTLQIMDFEIIKNLGKLSPLHKMTMQLSKVVKYALTDPTTKVNLREELEYLKAYLEILKVRFGDFIITYFEVDENVLDFEVFRLLLQPIVENCLEHGKRKDGGKERIIIKLKIYDREDQISFAIIDNGVGMTQQELTKLNQKIYSKGMDNIGLRNVNHRLLLHYGEESALQIHSKKNLGTAVSFRLPKTNNKNKK